MARFFLTNKPKAYKRARQINQEAGLKKAGAISENRIRGVIYKKRINQDINIYRQGSNHLLATTGTIIYEGKVGIDALKKKAGDRRPLIDRKGIYGHYSIISIESGKVNILSDRLGVYSIYYYSQEGTLFVSNSLYLTARALDISRVDKTGLIIRSVYVQNITRRTPFESIKRLDGNEYISIKESVLQVKEINVEQTNKINAKKYASKLKSIFNNISYERNDIGLHFTGGLDSRTVLSGIMAANKKPLLLYGEGNSQITNTKKKDKDLFSTVSSKLSLDKHLMDWKGNYVDHGVRIWNNYVKKYGFGYRMYGCNPSVFDEYEGRISPYPKFHVLGLGGGFTNTKPWMRYDKNEKYNIRNIVEDLAFVPAKSIIGSEIYNEIKSYLKNRYNIRGSEVHGSKLINIEIMLWCKCDGFTINILNEFTYSFFPLGMYELTSPLFQLSKSDRINNSFQIDIIKNNKKELLKLPFFSGGTEMIQTRGKLIPKIFQSSRPVRYIRKIARGLVPNIENIYPGKLQRLYRSKLYGEGLSKSIDYSKFDTRELNRLWCDLYCTKVAMEQNT